MIRSEQLFYLSSAAYPSVAEYALLKLARGLHGTKHEEEGCVLPLGEVDQNALTIER